MVTFEYKGVVEMKGETKAFGQNGFTKRELVVGNPPDSPSMYPNPVLFTFKKDRCALLDPVKVGDPVKIQFTIDGRKWDGPNGVRYFTDLTGWKIDIRPQSGFYGEDEDDEEPAAEEVTEAEAAVEIEEAVEE